MATLLQESTLVRRPSDRRETERRLTPWPAAAIGAPWPNATDPGPRPKPGGPARRYHFRAFDERRLADERRLVDDRGLPGEFEGRLNFLQIDDSTVGAIDGFKPMLISYIDSILNDFYAHMMALRETATAIDGAHAAPGGPNPTSAYRFLLNQIVDLVVQVHRDNPRQIAATLHAVTKAVFLDMERAIVNGPDPVGEPGPILSRDEILALLEGE